MQYFLNIVDDFASDRPLSALTHWDSSKVLCNNYTMAVRDLPEIYTQSPRAAQAQGLRVYISGKSLIAMV